MKFINSWDKTFILTISKYMNHEIEVNANEYIIKNNAYSFMLNHNKY